MTDREKAFKQAYEDLTKCIKGCEAMRQNADAYSQHTEWIEDLSKCMTNQLLDTWNAITNLEDTEQ